MSDLAIALEMPLHISSYFFANCRKQDHRLVQLHYVQLLCKNWHQKGSSVSTQFLCKLLFFKLLLNYPNAHTVQRLGGSAHRSWGFWS